jgi:hypothetical protein
MQGFGQLGQGAGQAGEIMGQEAKLNAPVNPQVEQFMRARLAQAMDRLKAGGDPVQESRSFQDDLRRALDSFKGGPPQVPGMNQPNVVPQTIGPSSPQAVPPPAQGSQQSAFSAPPAQTQQVTLPGMDSYQRPRSLPPLDYGPPPQQVQAPAPQPQTQQPAPQRIQQTQAAPSQQPRQTPMTMRDLQQFTALGPQMESMDRTAAATQSAQIRGTTADANNRVKLAVAAMKEAGLDDRTSQTLGLRAASGQLLNDTRVMAIRADIMMKAQAILAGKEIAGMKLGEDRAKAVMGLIGDIGRYEVGALAQANAAFDDEGKQQAIEQLSEFAGIRRRLMEAPNLGLSNPTVKVEPGTPGDPGGILPEGPGGPLYKPPTPAKPPRTTREAGPVRPVGVNGPAPAGPSDKKPGAKGPVPVKKVQRRLPDGSVETGTLYSDGKVR